MPRPWEKRTRRRNSAVLVISAGMYAIAGSNRVRMSRTHAAIDSGSSATTNVGLVMNKTAVSQPTCPAIDAMVFQLLGLTLQDTLPE